MEGFADIEGPVRIGLWALIGWIGLIVLLIGSLIALLVYFIRKRPKSIGPVVPERSPLEIALDRLEHLQEESSQMEADPFVVEVSDIVRYYLETSLKVPAREQTSEEFLHALQMNGDLPKILEEHMPDFLEQCDRVKFARQILALAQRDTLLETAGTVIKETDQDIQAQSDQDEEVKS